MSDFDDVRALVNAKDFEGALARVTQIEDRVGPSPRLTVLKAQCLQLSEGASLEQIETTLNRALSLDTECIEAYLELGWFRLVLLDDAEGARPAFLRAAELLAKSNEEVVLGLLACDMELNPGVAIQAARSQYQGSLIPRGPSRE